MSRTTAIVVTTIFEPAFLAGYLDAVRAAGAQRTTSIIIVPDRKTPATVAAAAAAVRREGFCVECPAIDEQARYLERLGVPDDFIPYDSDNRRNVGYLMAIDRGCEVLISIDDDNYCTPGTDFLGQHHVVGVSSGDAVVRSSDQWFNICRLLEADAGEEVFPRGFPYFAQRRARTAEMIGAGTPPRIAMNAGLWLDEPDIDAGCRLGRGPKSVAFTGPSVLLGPDVWSPINTQNTALTREAALTYYYVRMGYPLKGLSIDRYGDILSGYLTQKCLKHLGLAIRVGTPVLVHRRTPHNLFKDLYHELAGMVLVEEFVPWLIEEPLEGGTCLDAYASLASRIADAAPRFRGFIWDDGGRDFLCGMARSMHTWAATVRRWT